MTDVPENDVTLVDKESPFASAYVVAVFFCIALVMFGDVIFQSGDTVVSHRLSDGSQYFSRMRDFGFSELSKGNMPLWNPHIFSGTPFVGAFQTGMFYPLNAIYLGLPLANAMNVDTAFHVFLISVFMYSWARKRGLSWGASFVAGMILAYGGAGFARVMAGHITMLQAFAWAPLILLSIDHVVEKRSNGWMLIGVGATTMQILAGYPPLVLMTALAAGLYCCGRLIDAEHRVKIIVRLIPYAILPPLMACVQLWTGLDTASESMRSAGVSYDFATTFSFHPESLLTLFMPTFFGNAIQAMYWGRWSFWDSTIFMGIGGLALAASSMYFPSKSIRRYSFTLALIFTVLSFGSYTPIYSFFFEYIPGFSSFRSPAKFAFPAALFGAMLAGIGMDALLQGKVTSKKISVVLGIVGSVCFIGAIWLSSTSIGRGPTQSLIRFIDDRNASSDTIFISMEGFPLPHDYYVSIAWMMFFSCLVAGTTCLFLCAAMWKPKAKSWVAYAVPVMTVLEVLAFSLLHRPSFNLSDNDRPSFDALYGREPGMYRVMDVAGIDNSKRNHAVGVRKYSVWGYDPVVLDRYAQFVVFGGANRTLEPELLEMTMWGNDPLAESIHKYENYEFLPDDIDGDLTLFRLLRCRYIIINPGTWTGRSGYWEIGGALPRFFFSNSYSVHETKDSLFNEMKKDSFDPAGTVLLESEPVPKPYVLSDGETLSASINVVSQTTDSVEMEIEVDHNTLLVVTDSYSKNWRAVPLDNSVQNRYDVLPADYTLRGIPLAAGKHHFLLEYAPKSYTVGRWISLASVLFFLVCCVVVGYKRYSTPKVQSKI
jgi:hypothetical protein